MQIREQLVTSNFTVVTICRYDPNQTNKQTNKLTKAGSKPMEKNHSNHTPVQVMGPMILSLSVAGYYDSSKPMKKS